MRFQRKTLLISLAAVAMTAVVGVSAFVGIRLGAKSEPVVPARAVVYADLNEEKIRAGGAQVVIDIQDGVWKPEVGVDSAVTEAIVRSIVSRGSSPAGWNAVVSPVISSSNLTRISDSRVVIVLPPVPDYREPRDEVLQVSVPAEAVIGRTAPVTTTLSADFSVRAVLTAEQVDGLAAGLSQYAEHLRQSAVRQFSYQGQGDAIPLIGAVEIASGTDASLKDLAKRVSQGIDTQEDLYRALSDFAGTDNVVQDIDGVFSVSYVLNDVRTVPVQELSFEDEKFSLNSLEPVSLSTRLEMSLRFGVGSDGEFFIDNSNDLFRLSFVVGQSVPAEGRIGFVDFIGESSRIDITGALGIDLETDSDGATSQSEISAAGLAGLASQSYGGAARFDVPHLALADDQMPGVVSRTAVNWADIGKPGEMQLDLSDIEAKGFLNFRNVNIADAVSAIAEVADMLTDARHDGELGAVLPLSSKSLADIVNVGNELMEESDRVWSAASQTDDAGTLIYPDPSAGDLARILNQLNLAAEGAGMKITPDEIRYTLSFSKPAHGEGEQVPIVPFDLTLGEKGEISVKLDQVTALPVGAASIQYNITFGIKLAAAAELAAALGIDLRDSDGDGQADPCGFNQAPCHDNRSLDSDTDNDGLADLEDYDQDGDGVAESGVKEEDWDCVTVGFVTTVGCEKFLGINGLADEAAFEALPVGSPLKFDVDFNPPSPLTLEHRVFVVPGERLVTVAAVLGGASESTQPAPAHVGFLDVQFGGKVVMMPRATIGLSNSDTTSPDGLLDMSEARAARTSTSSSSVLAVALSGPIEARFSLENPLLADATDRGPVRTLQINGDLSALDNPEEGQPRPVYFVNTELGTQFVQPDGIYVRHNLDDVIGLKDITAADMMRLMQQVTTWLGVVEDDSVIGYPLPFAQLPPAKVASLHKAFDAYRAAVKDRTPRDFTTFADAANLGLEKAGIAGEVSFRITQGALTMSIPFGLSVTRQLPLTLEVPDKGDFRLLRTQDLNVLDVEAAWSFPLTTGLVLGAGPSSFDQRGFISVDSAPSLSVGLTGDLDAVRVVLGAFGGSISGSARIIGGKYTVTLNDADGNGSATLKELLAGSFVTNVVGAVTADMSVTVDTKEPVAVVARGNLRAIENVRTSKAVYNKEITDPAVVALIDPETADQIFIDPELDLRGLLVDLETMVAGYRDYAQLFVDITDLLSIDLPIIGDALSAGNQVARELVAAADLMQQLLQDVENDDQAFLEQIEGELEEFLNPAGSPFFIDVTVSGGLDDQEVVIDFVLTNEIGIDVPISAGLNLEPAFNFEFETVGVLTIGYTANIGFGVSVDDGFFVRGGPILGLTARMALEGIDASADLLSLFHMRIIDGEVALAGPCIKNGLPVPNEECEESEGEILEEACVVDGAIADDEECGEPAGTLVEGVCMVDGEVADSAECEPAAGAVVENACVVEDQVVEDDLCELGTRKMFLGAVLGEWEDGEEIPRVTLIEILSAEAPDPDEVQAEASCQSSNGEADGCDEQGTASGEGEEPPAEGEDPPAEGEEPPAEGEDPPAEGEEPPAEGEEPAEEEESVLNVMLLMDLLASLPVETNISVDFDGTTITFPTVGYTMVFAWNFNQPADEEEPSEPELAFEDIKINIGLLSDYVLPVLEVANTFNPFSIEEIRTILTTQIPLIGISLLRAGRTYAAISGDPTARAVMTAVDALIQLNTMVTTVKAQKAAGAETIWFPIGNAKVLPDFEYLPTCDDPPPGQDPVCAEPLSEEEVAEKMEELGMASLDVGAQGDWKPVSMPVLEDPFALVEFLTGRGPVTFFELDLGGMPQQGGDTGLFFGPYINQRYSLVNINLGFLRGSIVAGVRGCLCVIVRPGFGFDSRGFEEGHHFLDGLYIKDYYAEYDEDGMPVPGTDLPEIGAEASISLYVRGTISAELFVVSVGVSASGSGSIALTAGIDLNDESAFADDPPDGRMHLDEFLGILAGVRRPGSVVTEPPSNDEETEETSDFVLADSLKNLTAAQVEDKAGFVPDTGNPPGPSTPPPGGIDDPDFVELIFDLWNLPATGLALVGSGATVAPGEPDALDRIAELLPDINASVTVINPGDTFGENPVPLRFYTLQVILNLPSESIEDRSDDAQDAIVQAILDLGTGSQFEELLPLLRANLPDDLVLELSPAQQAAIADLDEDLLNLTAAQVQSYFNDPDPFTSADLVTLISRLRGLSADQLSRVGSGVAGDPQGALSKLAELLPSIEDYLNMGNPPPEPYHTYNLAPSFDVSLTETPSYESGPAPLRFFALQLLVSLPETATGSLTSLSNINNRTNIAGEIRALGTGGLVADTGAATATAELQSLTAASVPVATVSLADYAALICGLQGLASTGLAQVGEASQATVLDSIAAQLPGLDSVTGTFPNGCVESQARLKFQTLVALMRYSSTALEAVSEGSSASIADAIASLNESEFQSLVGLLSQNVTERIARQLTLEQRARIAAYDDFIEIKSLLAANLPEDMLPEDCDDISTSNPLHVTEEQCEDIRASEAGADPVGDTPGSFESVDTSGFMCLFNFGLHFGGSLHVSFRARISFLFFSISWGFSWGVNFRILDLDLTCNNDDVPTQVARVHRGVLRPNIGDDARKRGDGALNPDETVIFTPLSGGGVRVTYIDADTGEESFQDFYGVETIEVHGGDGDDVIVADPEFDQALSASGQQVLQSLSLSSSSAQVLTTLAAPLGPCNTGTPPITIPVYFTGGDGDDHLVGGTVDDILDGGAGDDWIEGFGGEDQLIGGSGDDLVCGGSGDDLVYGDATAGIGTGNDVLYGGSGDDTINAGGGNDELYGESGEDQLFGQSGNDSISGGNQDDYIEAGSGDDSITGDDGDDEVHAGTGNDTISGGQGADSLYGDDDNDSINGNDGDDYIEGGYGDDTLTGESGNDTLHGNSGNDTLNGGTGDDLLYGESGDDTINGQGGTDTIDGGLGTNTIIAGAEAVTIFGGSGSDIIHGSPLADQLFGRGGNDLIYGYGGDDYIEGGEDDDTIYGGEGQDDLIGGSARVSAPDGDDVIYGGDGAHGVTTNDDDVICADNCIITRPLDSSGALTYITWDTWNRLGSGLGNVIKRTVQLVDVPSLASPSIAGTFGDDEVYGENGEDLIYGLSGNDQLWGWDANDIIYGGPGDDDIYGELGDDYLSGGGGIDHIFGGGGRDIVEGGAADSVNTFDGGSTVATGTCQYGTRVDAGNDTDTPNVSAPVRTPSQGRNEGTKGQLPVKRKSPQCLQLVSISVEVTGSDPVAVGQTRQMQAIGTLDDGSTVDVTNEAVWTSSSTSVATIAPTGIVQVVATGTSQITARVHGIAGTGAICNCPIITTASLPAAAVSSPYSQALAAVGGTGPYAWSVNPGSSLPSGLSVSSGGTVWGSPLSAGVFSVTFRATDSNSQFGIKTLSITVNSALQIVTSSTLAQATSGTAISSITLAAAGGSGTYSWALDSGTLPAGLALSPAGVISGTPTAPAGYSFTVRVTDSNGATTVKTFSMTVNASLVITTSSPVTDEVPGANFGHTLVATGGTGGKVWSLDSGLTELLARGLILAPDGVISGATPVSGSASITVRVTDANGAFATTALTVTVP